MTQGPTTLGEMRQGHDPRVPGLLAQLEQLQGQLAGAVGVAQRAMGMVEGLVARLEHDEQLLEQLRTQPPVVHQLDAQQLVDEHGDPLPELPEVVTHLGELEQRQTLLAKAIVQLVPGAAAALRAGSSGR